MPGRLCAEVLCDFLRMSAAFSLSVQRRISAWLSGFMPESCDRFSVNIRAYIVLFAGGPPKSPDSVSRAKPDSPMLFDQRDPQQPHSNFLHTSARRPSITKFGPPWSHLVKLGRPASGNHSDIVPRSGFRGLLSISGLDYPPHNSTMNQHVQPFGGVAGVPDSQDSSDHAFNTQSVVQRRTPISK